MVRLGCSVFIFSFILRLALSGEKWTRTREGLAPVGPPPIHFVTLLEAARMIAANRHIGVAIFSVVTHGTPRVWVSCQGVRDPYLLFLCL